jgi:hypothetical protein
MISDHHLGIKDVIGAGFIGAAWEGRRTPSATCCRKSREVSAETVAAAMRTIFAQPEPGAEVDEARKDALEGGSSGGPDRCADSNARKRRA